VAAVVRGRSFNRVQQAFVTGIRGGEEEAHITNTPPEKRFRRTQ
jgi:hypothetical protein